MHPTSGGYPGWFRSAWGRGLAWAGLVLSVVVVGLLVLLVLITFVGFQIQGEDAGVRSAPIGIFATLVGLPFAGMAFGIWEAMKNWRAASRIPSEPKEPGVGDLDG